MFKSIDIHELDYQFHVGYKQIVLQNAIVVVALQTISSILTKVHACCNSYNNLIRQVH